MVYVLKEMCLHVTEKIRSKKIFFSYHIVKIMLDLSVTELKSIAKNRGIKGYNNLDKDELLKTILLSALSPDELRSISKFRKIKNCENMSEDELLNAFEDSKPFKDSKEIKNENQDDDEIIRDFRFFYEPEEDYYEPRKTKGAFGGNYVKYESNGDIDDVSSIEGYLNKIRPYLRDILDKHKNGWKIQLAVEITFSSVGKKDSKEFYPIYMHSDNSKVYIGSETSMVVDDLLKSLLNTYQLSLKRKMKKNNLTYDRVRAFYHKLHKISINRSGGSYTDSPDWIKNKKATINPKNKNDDKCMQYAISIASNHKQIKKDPQRISKIKDFVNKYNWKDINFPSHRKDWNTFEKNNESIALNIFYVPYNTKQVRPTYVSKHNCDRENQVILLMITDGKNWHYLPVKKLPELFRGITSKHVGDFIA